MKGEGFAFFRWRVLTFRRAPRALNAWRQQLRERRILYWWQRGLR